VGAGPVGLAALQVCQLFSPLQVLVVDPDPHRLQLATTLGATQMVDSTGEAAVARVLALTQGQGVDVAIEAVGRPETFDVCQAILAPGGRLANMGVHGKPVTFRLDRLWGANVTVTSRLVDALTTPALLAMVRAGRLDPRALVSHHYPFTEVVKAYDTFGHAAQNQAVKVVLVFEP
jgi:alcohol dehydrogenase